MSTLMEVLVVSSGRQSYFCGGVSSCPDWRCVRVWAQRRRNKLLLLHFDTHLLCVQQVEAVVYQETGEKNPQESQKSSSVWYSVNISK